MAAGNVHELRKVLDEFTADWELRFEHAADPGRRYVVAGNYDEGDKTLVVLLEGEPD